MERRITIDPRTSLLLGVTLLAVYVLSLLLPAPFMFLGVPVIVITAFLVVFQRYFSEIKLENVRVRQISGITFYTALIAILSAYTIFIVIGNAIGEFLFAMSIILFCFYVTIPGLAELLEK